MSDLALAYARCEEITGAEARNFSYGIRLLPTAKRQSMSALYAFARRVDDVGDGPLPATEKLAALASLRADLEATAAGRPPAADPVLVALADTLGRFAVPLGALQELITGCEMDCRQQRYETYEELVVYCRYVAGSIGRCSLGIFGSSSEAAPALSDTLGVALQITNILRDVLEDRDVMGRVYLPAEDLRRFGCSEDARGSREALAELVRFEASRAESAYSEGLALLDLIDRRSRACVGAMAGIYRRLLSRIEAEPLAVLERRVSLPSWEKAWVAARSLAGARA
ncbi:MAG: hpnD [Acidimicrobiaceae bacterium]|nr:hpnD [Acidimicrobiaceae bacterium]